MYIWGPHYHQSSPDIKWPFQCWSASVGYKWRGGLCPKDYHPGGEDATGPPWNSPTQLCLLPHINFLLDKQELLENKMATVFGESSAEVEGCLWDLVVCQYLVSVCGSTGVGGGDGCSPSSGRRKIPSLFVTKPPHIPLHTFGKTPVLGHFYMGGYFCD